MKRMILEFIMVLHLVILSGIVLADDFFHQLDAMFSITEDQKQWMENNTGYIRGLDLKKRMKDVDGIKQTNYERNRLVGGYQYFYAKGHSNQNKIIKL